MCVAKRRLSMFYSIRLFFQDILNYEMLYYDKDRRCTPTWMETLLSSLYTMWFLIFIFGKFNWRSLEWWCLSKLSTSHCVLNGILETTSSMWQHQYITKDWLVIYLLTANEMLEVLPPSPLFIYIYWCKICWIVWVCVCVFFSPENIRNLI